MKAFWGLFVVLLVLFKNIISVIFVFSVAKTLTLWCGYVFSRTFCVSTPLQNSAEPCGMRCKSLI